MAFAIGAGRAAKSLTIHPDSGQAKETHRVSPARLRPRAPVLRRVLPWPSATAIAAFSPPRGWAQIVSGLTRAGGASGRLRRRFAAICAADQRKSGSWRHRKRQVSPPRTSLRRIRQRTRC